MNEHLQNRETEFERSDLSALGILGFLAGLAIVGFVLHIILVGIYVYLDTYTKKHEPPVNPLARATAQDMRNPKPEVANEFPLPRLETNEIGERDDRRIQEENILSTYGWVDQKAGVAHIPIDRAMQLIAQRGLPLAPSNMAQKDTSQIINRPAAAVPAKR
jgi:hypothetical protein